MLLDKRAVKHKKLLLAYAAGLTLLLNLSTAIAVVETAAPNAEPTGMVWERHGDWHLNGSMATLRLGEAIPPGGLISAGNTSPIHSLTVLFPDGQRMLCECFDQKTCAQGFRVPQITPLPTPSTWKMFVGVRNALLSRPADSEAVFPQAKGRAEMAANFEMVAQLSPRGEISIAPALRVLPAGQYSLTVRSDGSAAPAASFPAAQPLDWKANPAAAPVRVGGAGLYHILVSDQTHVPRIRIEILATSAAAYATEASALKQTRDTVRKWSEAQESWPLHSFLGAYLESRAKEVNLSMDAPQTSMRIQDTIRQFEETGVPARRGAGTLGLGCHGGSGGVRACRDRGEQLVSVLFLV